MTTIAGQFPNGFDLNNAALNPVTVTGTISGGTSGLTAALQGETVAAWSVLNQGTIAGGTISGIDLLAGGTVTNAASALISGFFGVEIQGIAGTVANSGTIDTRGESDSILLTRGGQAANLAGGTILSSADGITTEGAAATVTNAGIVNASTTGAGVNLLAGGNVTNVAGGTLTGNWGISIQGASTGSVLNGGVLTGGAQSGVFITGGTVTNLAGGTISGNWGVADVNAAGTVISAGIIIGTNGTAVTLPSGVVNRVVDNPGAAFVGLVDGGNTVGAASVSTLELGAAPLQGTLTALGVQFLDFGQIVVDPGASWAFTGTNTVTAGMTLTDQGTLAVNAATLTGAAALTIASSASVFATMSLAGGGVMSGIATLTVGDGGQGSLLVDGPASASAAAAVLGASAGGVGDIDVTGSGAQFSATGSITVGGAGFGGLTVRNQATVLTGGLTQGGADIAQTLGGGGSITVTGTQSLFSNTGKLVVGDAAAGSLSVNSGGTIITSPGSIAGVAGLAIANTAGAAGSFVDISGAGSNLQVTGLLDVGVSGSGALSISNGATVSASSLDAGNIISAVANISVTNANFAVSGDATVADDGTGVLSVLAGATFAAANLTIGSQGDSSGAVVVSGAGSVINIAGNLNVGTALGTGDLTIGPGGAVHAKVVNLQGQVVLENGFLDPTVNLINQGQTAGGSGTIAAGDIVDEGLIQAGGSKPSQKLLVVSGTVLGGGPWTINGTAQAQANGGVGVLQINAGGTLELTGPVLNAATTTFTDDVTPQSTYTVTNSVIDVNFGDATGVLKLDDIAGFAGTIAANQKGDSFVITAGTLSNLGVSNSNTLTVSDSGNGGTDSLIFASAISAAGFSIVNGNTIQVACFAAGTRIETAKRLVTVEALAVGDEVRTMLGGPGRIVWIGSRPVDCARHPAPETVWPVRIARGAFAENVPVRDLFVSPDHAIYVDGVLIPAKYLLNGTTIRQVKRRRVVYYHIELARHDVVLAEGLPAETYLDSGDRAKFSGGPVTVLHPEFAARTWQAAGCAELVVTGAKLDAVRGRIKEHATTRHGKAAA